MAGVTIIGDITHLARNLDEACGFWLSFGNFQFLRPYGNGNCFTASFVGVEIQFAKTLGLAGNGFARTAQDLRIDQVHLADEVRHKAGRGLLIEFYRGCDLLNGTLVDHGNAAGHGKGFILVMGNNDKSDPNSLLKARQFHAHVIAEFCVKGGEWFIEKQNLGAFYKGPRQCHALALTA